jgi:WD40 repeat protein
MVGTMVTPHSGMAVGQAIPAGVRRVGSEAAAWPATGQTPRAVSCVYVRRLDGLPRVFAEWIDGLHLSSDGATAMSANTDDPVMVWDTGSGALRRALEGTKGHIAAALSADGTTAVTGGDRGEDPGEISVWDTGTGARLRTLTGCHGSGVATLAISADGYRALSAGRDLIVHLWDLRSGQRMSAYPEIDGFSAATLDRDKDLAMIASRGHCHVD